MEHLTKARERALEWAKTLSGDAAWQEAPEDLARFAPNAITAAHGLSQHEFIHAGQLTAIRSSLGMEPVFG